MKSVVYLCSRFSILFSIKDMIDNIKSSLIRDYFDIIKGINYYIKYIKKI